MHSPYFLKGEDPDTTIKNLGAYIKHVHITDAVKTESGIEYCLIGEGDMRSELLALAEGLGVCDSVSFLGRKENPASFMAAADVYVSASKSEGLPFNVVEALGAGVPVIATDVKGHKDILEDGAGVLFAQNDDEALLKALENVYTGKYIRNDNAVAAATAKFGFDNVFPDTYEKIKKAGELA
jgi:glycosyltransferase EpsD